MSQNMAKNTLIEKAAQEYEDILENKGSGVRIIAAFTAIGKWLRLEKELDDIITWRKARTLAGSLVLRSDTYDVDPEVASEANRVGIGLAKAYFDAKQEYYFRGFIKNLGITGMADTLTSEETGDLIVCLLILHVVVEDNESHNITKKYIKDIKDICIAQLDGDKIYKTSLDIASKIYSDAQEELDKMFKSESPV